MKLKVLVWLAIVLFTTFSVNANGLLNGQITRTGQDIYSATCTVCHSTGVANAPKLQNAQDWELRLGKGFDVLLQNAIAGLGAHPPRGTCLNCSDDEIKSALSYMLEGLLEAPVEDIDTDNDGIIDLSDPDDDNDDIPDTYELANGLDPLDATDAVLDNDSDGLSNYDEFLAGTNLNSADTDQDGINDSIDNQPLRFGQSSEVLFSYTFTGNQRGDAGNIITGLIEGMVAADNDTIEILEFKQISLAGIDYQLSESIGIQAILPANKPKMSLSGAVLDFWVCVQGFSQTTADGSGDCPFGAEGGFLFSQAGLDSITDPWALAGIPELGASYRNSDIPLTLANWQAEIVNSETDTDNDNIADIFDPDDDNDDIPDTYELANGLDPLDATDAVLDNDSDGLSNYDEFLAGTNLNSADTDQDGINDSVDNNPLVFDEPLPPTNSGVLTVLPDLNDDGIAEIGILNIDSITAKVQLEVLNGKDQSALNVLSWTDNFEDSSLTLHIIPDMNNNGADEVGLFGIQDVANNEGKPQVFVRDLQTGNRVNVYNWPANWQSVSALVLTDISGDGIVEIGIQGRFKEGERPQLVIKNGADGSNEATYSYPNLFNSPMFYQHSDVDGDGFEEIATFGVISRNNKIQVKIANGINSNNKMKAYNFPDKWENISWHRLDDSNNDGVDDWGLFGVSKADGRPQLINKDGTDPTGALRIYAWIADMSNAQFYRIPDMNNDSVDEVAAAGRRSNGRYQFQVQDGVDRNSVLANHNLNLKLENLSFHVLPDLSGDEKAEIGFLGINAQGEYELVIRHGNAGDGEYASYNLGSDWQNTPSITSLGDTNEDDLPNLLIYGQKANGETLNILYY
jgi:cytochrome c5